MMSLHEEQHHDEYDACDEGGDNGLWEKPTWANGGVKLRSTGKGQAMKEVGNLAAVSSCSRPSLHVMLRLTSDRFLFPRFTNN
jgi:hypothetical protein